MLVVSEIAFPGWRAFVDGVETPILRADYMLLGVEVPAGSHQVTLSYEPWSARIGALATALGLAGLLTVLALWLRRGLGRRVATRPGSPTGEPAPATSTPELHAARHRWTLVWYTRRKRVTRGTDFIDPKPAR